MNKVIVVDDHKIISEMVERTLLEHGFDVIGNYQLGNEFLKSRELLKCELLILDLSLPDMNGKEIISEIKTKGYDIKIIVLTSKAASTELLDLYQLGIDSFINKSKDPKEIITAINSINEGSKYFPDISFMDIVNSEKEDREGNIELSPRELEIAKLLADQKSNQEITDKLYISINTVKAHKKSLYKKLNVSSEYEFRSEAIRKKII